MLTETGRVIRIDGDSVWVQTMRHSVCGSCQARMGCGQNLMNQLVGVSADIKVKLDSRAALELAEGDMIEIGIEEGAVVTASILAYGVPLLFLIFSILIADAIQASGFALFLLCVAGVSAGIAASRIVLASRFRPVFFEPVFLRRVFLRS